LSEGAGGLDLAEDRFNDLLSQAISAAPELAMPRPSDAGPWQALGTGLPPAPGQ
jgi:hypothetical protein